MEGDSTTQLKKGGTPLCHNTKYKVNEMRADERKTALNLKEREWTKRKVKTGKR